MAQHVFYGSGAPSTIPTAVGQHYIDTSNKISYVSVGTSSSSDWETSDAAAVEALLDAHIANTGNPHSVTKSQVGLSNVDNTSDANKPVSTATATALSGKQDGPLTGDVTTSGASATLAASGVTAGSYTSANITVDAKGRITAASNGSGGGGTWGSITGTLSDQTDLQSALDAKLDIPSASNNQFIYRNNSGTIEGIPNWFIDNNHGGASVGITAQPNNDSAYIPLHSFGLNIDPLQNSPDDSYALFQNNISFDINSSGFTQGTNGNAAKFFSLAFGHSGTGDIGEINFFNNSFEIGNGTDPISARGMSYCYGFGSFHANVNINGPLQGYGFQPNANAATTFDASAGYTTAFYDAANFPIAVGSWTSANFSPTLGSIQNNYNYTGASINPNITTFTGNAGFTGVGIYGTLGTFGTGSFQGININPTITSVTNANGISINMSNVTGTNVKAMDITGDVSINGDLSFTGALSIGQLNAFYAVNVASSTPNPTSLHGLVTQVTSPNGVTTANGDTIGVNTAMLMVLEDNSTITSGAFSLGLSALALPCVVETHTGSSVDFMNAAVYAINLSGTSTGGTIDNLNLCRTVAIPNGITTVNKMKAYAFDLPFGDPGTATWGLYLEPDVNSWIKGRLKIGGTAGSTDTVFNSSYGLHLDPGKLALIGDGTLVSGDLRALLRIGYQETDPDTMVAASRLGANTVLDLTFTDDNATSAINDYHLLKLNVAATKSLSSPCANVFTNIGRADAADAGFVPYAINFLGSYTHGNNASKHTGLYASFMSGFHSVDNQGTIDAYYDFYAASGSAGAGVITARYGIVIEPESNYTKSNWIAGKTQIGGGSLGSLTDVLNVVGAMNSDTSVAVGSAMFLGTTTAGFFGQTPTTQPTSSGAATAGILYTATEQTMLQEVYDAVRALGLMS